MTNLDSILKSRDITLPTKVHLVKAMLFPIVMYGCEIWTIKKAEQWRIVLLKCGVRDDSWESFGLQGDPTSQSILKEFSPDYSLERLMLRLKLQYFVHLMWRPPSLEETLMLGKTEGRRRRGQQRWDGWMASPTQWTWVWVNSSSWWWTGRPGVLWSWGREESDMTERLNWNELNVSKTHQLHNSYQRVNKKDLQEKYTFPTSPLPFRNINRITTYQFLGLSLKTFIIIYQLVMCLTPTGN